MTPAPAIFFDGEVAAGRAVTITLSADGVSFSGAGVTSQLWTFASLEAVDRPAPGLPLRLATAARPAARLVIADEAVKTEILTQAPHLRGGINVRRAGVALGWIAGGLLLVTAVAYLVVQIMPQKIALLLPDQWRDRVGAQIETSLAGDARRCETKDGTAALSAIAARLTEGNPDMPPVAIHVYGIPIMNAFAMPGGRIVITAELIRQAATPEEVAGVLAHEMGHVAYRHPEAQIVRATGLQILLAVMTGGGGGDTLSQVAGVAAILRYSRGAESEADAYALKALTASAIDPLGLKHFFERVLKEKGKSSTGTFGKIEGAFATHPGTEERITHITPLPENVVARPVMNETQWQALKAICG